MTTLSSDATSVSNDNTDTTQNDRSIQDMEAIATQCAESVLAPVDDRFLFGGFTPALTNTSTASTLNSSRSGSAYCFSPDGLPARFRPVIPVIPHERNFTYGLAPDNDEALVADWRLKEAVRQNNRLQLLDNLLEDIVNTPLPAPRAVRLFRPPILLLHATSQPSAEAAPTTEVKTVRTKQKYAHLRDRVTPPRALNISLCEALLEKERMSEEGERVEVETDADDEEESNGSDEFFECGSASSNGHQI